MSLIDQALKKTQKDLRQQKRAKSVSPSVNNPYKIPPYTTDNSFSADDFLDFCRNRWVIGTGVALVLAALILIFPPSQLAHRYENFYSGLFHSVVTKKSAPPVTLVSTITTAPLSSLELEGTVQVSHHQAAMINQQLLNTGETILGYRVEHIQDNAVDVLNLQTHEMHRLTQALTKR